MHQQCNDDSTKFTTCQADNIP